LTHALQGDVHRLERLRRHALALVDQTQQEVLGADVVVVEHPRLFLREDDHPSGPVGESFKHSVPPGAHQRSVRRRVPLGSPDPVLPRRQLRRPANACRAPSAPEGDYTRGVGYSAEYLPSSTAPPCVDPGWMYPVSVPPQQVIRALTSRRLPPRLKSFVAIGRY